MNLTDLGWNENFSAKMNEYKMPGLAPGRITCVQKNLYDIMDPDGVYKAEISGRLFYTLRFQDEFPVVGDWVLFMKPDTKQISREQKVIIHSVLPRMNSISRKTAGQKIEEQVMCANIDLIFIVTACGYDFNLRRIERYLTLVNESGIKPAIIINKTDLADDLRKYKSEIQGIAANIPVFYTNAVKNIRMIEIEKLLVNGKTFSFLGSSGVGKSTIINNLLGLGKQKVNHVQNGGKGKHTTTARQLYILPQKGILIDNPGMRELQLWSSLDSVDDTFSDIDELAVKCRFSDCKHDHEPGCAVIRAVSEGILDEKRVISYRKQKIEIRNLQAKAGIGKKELIKLRNEKFKDLSKQIKKMKKNTNKYHKFC